MKIFFDTSCYVKRFIEEVGSKETDKIIETANEVGLSIICYPEIISALSSKLRARLISEAVYNELKQDILIDLNDADIINLTVKVLQNTTDLLEKNVLRTLDAIHIASALEWGAELFVSSDYRQVDAAKHADLEVTYIAGMQPIK